MLSKFKWLLLTFAIILIVTIILKDSKKRNNPPYSLSFGEGRGEVKNYRSSSSLTFSEGRGEAQNPSSMHTFAFRLKPGDDLKKGIHDVVVKNNIKAGWIATCVGSLVTYNIRFANQPNGSTGSGHFEIVSLTGTLSVNGSHIHVSISDSVGKTIGGHLMDGNIIYTTAEVVIQQSDQFEFTREKDGSTPWEELQVKPR